MDVYGQACRGCPAGEKLMVTKQRNRARLLGSIDGLQCYAEGIKDYLDNLDSERTAGALVERYGTFVKWAREVEQREQRQVCLLPVEPSDLVDYAKALDDRGLALSTITSYVSAIGTIHSAVNERSPTRSKVVKSEIAKLRARHADAQRHARPLSDDEIDRILKSCRDRAGQRAVTWNCRITLVSARLWKGRCCSR